MKYLEGRKEGGRVEMEMECLWPRGRGGVDYGRGFDKQTPVRSPVLLFSCWAGVGVRMHAWRGERCRVCGWE